MESLNEINVSKEIFNSKVWAALDSDEALLSGEGFCCWLLFFTRWAEGFLGVAVEAARVEFKCWEQFCDVLGEGCFSDAWRSDKDDVSVHEER